MADTHEIQTRANELKGKHSARDEMFSAFEDIYFLHDPDRSKHSEELHQLAVVSPTGRNQTQGGIRLMTATDPEWNVLGDEFKRYASAVETWCKAAWAGAGRLAGSPVHYDLVTSAMLYGEVDISIVKTSERLRLLEESGASKAAIARMKKAAGRAPFLFPVMNPKGCYPAYDDLGMYEHYQETKSTVGRIKATYGKDAEKLFKDLPNTTEVTKGEWWDLENWVIWIHGYPDDPIVNIKHDLPFIPIKSAITEGSYNLFNNVEYQRQPFLYALHYSGMWGKENLAMSTLSTLAYGMGCNPMYVFEQAVAGTDLELDFSRPGGLAKLRPGEKLSPMAKQVIDPAIMTMLNLAQEINIESTIYKQALGQPLRTTYSEASLMAQAGRLPLENPKRRLEHLLGDIMETCLEWERYKEEEQTQAFQDGKPVVLNLKEIPEDISINCALDVNLPQEKLQLANIAIALQKSGLVDNAWVLENILGIGQPEVMSKKVWEQRFVETMMGLKIQQIVQALQAMMQPQQPAEVGGNVAGAVSAEAANNVPPAFPPLEPGPKPEGVSAEMQAAMNELAGGIPNVPRVAPVQPAPTVPGAGTSFPEEMLA